MSAPEQLRRDVGSAAARAIGSEGAWLLGALRPVRGNVAPRQLHRVARKLRDSIGQCDHLRPVILVDQGVGRRSAAEAVAEIDPDVLGFGEPSPGLRPEPPRVACDGITSDVELPVCVLERPVHMARGQDQMRGAVAGGRERSLHGRMRLAQPAQVRERIGVDAGRGKGGEGVLQPGGSVRDSAGARLGERSGEVAAALLGERSERGFGVQCLNLEGVHRVEERRGSAQRCSGCLERDVRVLALPGLAPPLGHADAVLGESEQLSGIRWVGLDAYECPTRITGGEPLEGLASVWNSCAQPLDIGAHAGVGLRTSRPCDPLGEGGRLGVEHLDRPLAQLHDAQVTGSHVVSGAREHLMIAPVQSERVMQVAAHFGENLACPHGCVRSELGLGEAELLGGDSDALVGADQSGGSLLRQLGVAHVGSVRMASANYPEPGHVPSYDRRSRPAMEQAITRA